MHVKSALLATAAGLMAVSGAYAADLPGEAAPAAVDYVKVCDAYGAGFFYIPGSDTCLKIRGRLRASVTYTNNDGDKNAGADSVNFRADGYVGFDARQSTDFGPLRSYIELGAGSVKNTDGVASSDRSINLDQGFIQLGYVTVGRQDEVADGSGLYGINDSTWAIGDFTATGASVLVDKIAGSYFVGAGIYSNDDQQARPNIWKSDSSANYQVSGIAGINKQSWGDANLSGVYRAYDATSNDVWGVKLTGNFILSDVLTARAWVAYQSVTDDGVKSTGVLTTGTAENLTEAALAIAYQATKEASVYAGVRYQSVDGGTAPDNAVYGNLGVNYALASNLNLQGEVDYTGADDFNQFKAVTRLVRTW